MNRLELFNGLSMLVAIPYSCYCTYAMIKLHVSPLSLLFWQFTAPLSYVVLCCTSATHHLVAYRDGQVNLYWLKVDLVSQLFICAVNVLHESYGTTDAAVIIGIIMIYEYIDFRNDSHRSVAYIINGVTIIVITRAHPEIIINWIASFSLFGIGGIYPNDYAHSLFHFYNHYNMNLIWNGIIGRQADTDAGLIL